MFPILTELLSYARKLLPLLELYSARRPVQLARDPATEEFQNYAAETLRGNRAELLHVRSALEAIEQRLKVLDDHSLALERELARMADRQRTLVIAVLIAAASAVGAFVAAMVVVTRR